MFDDGPNENYVGHPKMKGIYDRLEKRPVRFGRSWDQLPEAKEFCKKLMEFDVNKRLDAAEALMHPWILKGAPA